MKRPLLETVAVLLSASVSAGVERDDRDRRRFVAVNVVDREGAQVLGLTADQFRGEFRGQPVEVLSANLDLSPRRIAVILDRSGSTRGGGDAWDFAFAATEELINGLAAPDELALFTIGDDLVQRSAFSNDHAVIRATLARIRTEPPYGSSALYKAMVLAALSLDGQGFGGAVYLISDCLENSSLLTTKETAVALAGTGARAFTVCMPLPPRAHPRPGFVSLTAHFRQAAVEAMNEVAEATGGVVFHPEGYPGPDKLQELRSFHRLVKQVYRVEIRLPRPVDKARRWKLRALVDQGKGRSDVRIVYPSLLVPR